METPKTEEIKRPVNSEEKKEEAPKKKKNIIRVYHAQNASDGGKGRRRPPEGARPARPAGAGRPGQPRPVKSAGTEGAAPAAKAAARTSQAAGKAAAKLSEAGESVKSAVKAAVETAAQVKAKASEAAHNAEKSAGKITESAVKTAEAVLAAQKTAAEKMAKAPEKEGKPAEAKVPEKVEKPVKEEKPAAAASKAPEKEEKPAAAPAKAPEKEEKPAAAAPKAPEKEEKPAAAAPKAPEKEEKPAAAAPKAPEKEEKPAAAAPKAPEKEEKPAKEAVKAPEKEENKAARTSEREERPASKSPERDGNAAAQNRRPSGDGSARPAQRQGRDGQRSDYRDNRTSQGYGDGRTGDRRDSRDTRPGSGASQGQARPQRSGEGYRGPRTSDGQGRYNRPDGSRPEGGRTEGSRPDGTRRYGAQGQGQQRPQGQGRPYEGRSDSRSGDRGMNDHGDRDNSRFGGQGQKNQGGQRQGARRSGADAGFTPELSKNTKDSKRERDRENKNKKKEFDKTAETGRRPAQGTRQGQPQKPLQKPQAAPKQEEKKPEIKEIILPEKLTIRELADAMKLQPSVIVKKLFLQGIMVTVNQEIDFEKAQEIALEYDIIAEKEEKVDVIEELLKEDEEKESDMVPRPPVVCVMGHVDHGKTSLLDAIRNTNVTRGEAGGITQHIGAYVVTINGQKITFLDTPGHEAFTAMRMRGANATDIAVLVVAADDGVMPQTVEAISHAKAAGVEIIVAINKIDKPSANIERVKQELSEYELIPEDWGGSTVFVPVSAKTGEGIDTLLEMILLTAEVSELKANPKRAARGLVIEAQLDKGKGPVATILIQKGTLHVGDFIAAGACSGKVRAMMDDKGRRVKEALPSTPVEILGLGDVPNAGEVLMSFPSDKEAKNFAGAFVSENKNRLLEETKGKLSLDNLFDQIQASDLKELPIVVKADVQGSVEAVKQSLVKLSNEEVVVKVIHGGVGAINESDVSLAATTNAIIIGFNVRPDATAKQMAEQEKVDMRLYKVIYQAIEDVEAAMKGMLDPVYEEKVIGHAEVRQLFKASGIGTIAGSYVLDGIFQRNCKVRITREGEQVFEGDLASLKRFKDDVKEVRAGYECGLVFDGFNDLKEEDQIEAYIMVEVPR